MIVLQHSSVRKSLLIRLAIQLLYLQLKDNPWLLQLLITFPGRQKIIVDTNTKTLSEDLVMFNDVQ